MDQVAIDRLNSVYDVALRFKEGCVASADSLSLSPDLLRLRFMMMVVFNNSHRQNWVESTLRERLTEVKFLKLKSGGQLDLQLLDFYTSRRTSRLVWNTSETFRLEVMDKWSDAIGILPSEMDHCWS